MRAAASALALGMALAATAAAGVPPVVALQARLTDGQNQPIHGTFDVTVTLWSAAEGGDAVWQEVHTGVQVSGGWLRVTLGSVDPLLNPLDAAAIGQEPLWLGVTLGEGPELGPRQALTAVPWAVRTEVAEGVADGALHGDSFALATITFDKLAQTCAEGQVLVMTGGAWQCGEYDNQRLPD